jgi:hypothetical protein
MTSQPAGFDRFAAPELETQLQRLIKIAELLS